MVANELETLQQTGNDGVIPFRGGTSCVISSCWHCCLPVVVRR